MPSYIQVISEVLPLTPFLNGLRRIVFMGSSLQDVLPEIKSLTIMIVVFGILGWSVLKLKIRNYIRKGALNQV
jgi:ABC-2 type transport system permease protein